MNTKTILASTLFTALLIGSSANADMRGDLSDYADNTVATQTVKMQKASLVSSVANLVTSAVSYDRDTNR